jgi:hypothetical protein
MEMNNTRRNVLRYMSLGAVSAAVPASAQAMANDTPVSVQSDAEKDGPVSFEALQFSSGTKRSIVDDSGGIAFMPPIYEEYKQISMSVGQDGNLWVKTEAGIWKRIVTE